MTVGFGHRYGIFGRCDELCMGPEGRRDGEISGLFDGLFDELLVFDRRYSDASKDAGTFKLTTPEIHSGDFEVLVTSQGHSYHKAAPILMTVSVGLDRQV